MDNFWYQQCKVDGIGQGANLSMTLQLHNNYNNNNFIWNNNKRICKFLCTLYLQKIFIWTSKFLWPPIYIPKKYVNFYISSLKKVFIRTPKFFGLSYIYPLFIKKNHLFPICLLKSNANFLTSLQKVISLLYLLHWYVHLSTLVFLDISH